MEGDSRLFVIEIVLLGIKPAITDPAIGKRR